MKKTKETRKGTQQLELILLLLIGLVVVGSNACGAALPEEGANNEIQPPAFSTNCPKNSYLQYDEAHPTKDFPLSKFDLNPSAESTQIVVGKPFLVVDEKTICSATSVHILREELISTIHQITCPRYICHMRLTAPVSSLAFAQGEKGKEKEND